MVWWIAGGVVLFALVLLAVVAVGTVGRAAGMRRAVGTAQQRQAQAEALRLRVAEMQESLAALQIRAEVTRERLAAIQASRAGRPNSGQAAAKRTMASALTRGFGRRIP